MTSARAAYEPPYADIIEFAVERGFDASGGASPVYDYKNGNEVLGRDADVEL